MEKETIEIGLPHNMEFYDHGHFIRIVRKWFSQKIIVFTFFTIFWNVGLIIWYSDTVRSCPFDLGSLAVKFFLLFLPVAHVVIGIHLTYYVIAGFLNKTLIRVDNSRITVRHKPLPFFWGNKTLSSSGIKQLYSKEKITHNRDTNRVSKYELRLITHDKKDVKLISGLESPKQVLFIEQAIEKFLKIKDKSVKGEIIP